MDMVFNAVPVFSAFLVISVPAVANAMASSIELLATANGAESLFKDSTIIELVTANAFKFCYFQLRMLAY